MPEAELLVSRGSLLEVCQVGPELLELLTIGLVPHLPGFDHIAPLVLQLLEVRARWLPLLPGVLWNLLPAM